MGPRGDRREPRRSLAAGQAGERRQRRCVHRGLLQLGPAPRDGAVHPRIARRGDRRRTHRLRFDPALPRPCVGQGARHEAADTVAPGPAVLQRRRRAERQHVVPGRSGRSLGDPGVRRRHPPRPVVHAAHVPRRPGQVVPRRQPRRAARLRRRSRSVAGDRLGARAGRRRVLQHAHRARFGRRVGTNRRRVLSVRYLGDDMVHAPRRWTTSPPFDGLDAELADGAPMDHPLFPLLWTRDGALVS